jgi:hypothetical protein
MLQPKHTLMSFLKCKVVVSSCRRLFGLLQTENCDRRGLPERRNKP